MESEDTQRKKVILHMDGDAFFVAVEVAKNPSLRGLPVVTGQERGIVSALSYEAKALGITRTMSIYSVKKNFPQVIILSGDYKSYVAYSKKMFDIVRRYADDVEEYSIDECFADLTGLDKPLKMSYKEIAERIKREVREELDLSVTIGLAPNKVLAKVASKWEKPNGLTIITQENKDTFLKQFPIEKIWGIGKATKEHMLKKGIITAYDLKEKEKDWILDHFSKPYYVMWKELHGEYCMQINPVIKTEYASIQKTRTFHPSTSNQAFLLQQLSFHIEDACTKARHYMLTPKKLSFFIKDEHMRYVQTTITLSAPTHAPELLIKAVEEKFDTVYNSKTLYRATGITLLNLIHNNGAQMDLFGETDRVSKFETIHKHIDALEQKFGKRIVHLASTTRKEDGEGIREEMDDEDRNLLFL